MYGLGGPAIGLYIPGAFGRSGTTIVDDLKVKAIKYRQGVKPAKSAQLPLSAVISAFKSVPLALMRVRLDPYASGSKHDP